MFYQWVYWQVETHTWFGFITTYSRRARRELYGRDWTDWVYSTIILRLTEGGDDE